MSNYESIPVDTRNIIEDGLHLNDNLKNAVGRLWRLYLRVNHGESDPAEQELQNFLNTLQQYIGQPEIMLNVIDQKINDLEREINGNDFNGRGGIKKRKTGKKRKRTNKKTSKKRKRTIKKRIETAEKRSILLKSLFILLGAYNLFLWQVFLPLPSNKIFHSLGGQDICSGHSFLLRA